MFFEKRVFLIVNIDRTKLGGFDMISVTQLWE